MQISSVNSSDSYPVELPALMAERLQQLVNNPNPKLRLSKTQFASAVIICERLLTHLQQEVGLLTGWMEIPSTYFKEIDTNYQFVLKPLVRAGILIQQLGSEGKVYYSTALKQCTSYRFDATLFEFGAKQIFLNKKPKQVDRRDTLDFYDEKIKHGLSLLSFDSKSAKLWLSEYVDTLDLTNWCVDEKHIDYKRNRRIEKVRLGIETNELYREGKPCLVRYLVQDLRRNQPGFKLFKTSNKYIVATPEEFIKKKAQTIFYHYSKVIDKLHAKDFWTSQANTNNRIHHNLTELPKRLLKFISINGQPLAEVDITNSQVALLAHIMQHGDVLELGLEFPPLPEDDQASSFVSDAKSGCIYDRLAKLTEGGDRDIAKLEVMQWLFSGAGFHIAKSSPISQLYRPIVTWVRQAKQLFKPLKSAETKMNLAIYLQRLEAKLMMEEVYPLAKKRGYFLLGKHDSFLTSVMDAQALQKLMEEVIQGEGIAMNVRCKASPLPIVSQAA